MIVFPNLLGPAVAIVELIVRDTKTTIEFAFRVFFGISQRVMLVRGASVGAQRGKRVQASCPCTDRRCVHDLSGRHEHDLGNRRRDASHIGGLQPHEAASGSIQCDPLEQHIVDAHGRQIHC
jgi:hypothetical protein